MWILILSLFVGGNAVNMTTISGFSSEHLCKVAGFKVSRDISKTKNEIVFTCLKKE